MEQTTEIHLAQHNIFNITNIMPVDDLETQGARSATSTMLTCFIQNIFVSFME